MLNELKSAVAEKVEILKAGVNGNINSASGLDLTDQAILHTWEVNIL